MEYNIAEHPDFCTDNIAPAVNATVARMQPGDRASLSYGVYQIREPLRIRSDNRLKYCSIRLSGIYEVPSADLEAAVQVEGDYLTFEMDKLTSNDKSDYYNQTEDDILPGGVSIGESCYSEYVFGEIEGFEFGIRLRPLEADTGLCFNKIRFRKLSYCYMPFLLSVPDGVTGWINENQIFGGTVKGYFGVVYRKGSEQIDECNNNTFYNLAFEAIETDAIVADFCAFNTFIAPRFECVNRLTIKESATCKNNKYYISVDIPFCSVSVQSRNTMILGPLHNKHWENIIRALYTDCDGNKHYEFYKRTSVRVQNKNAVLTENVNEVEILADKYPVSITLSTVSAFDDNRIRLLVRRQAFPITICDPDGSVLAEGESLCVGTYELFFANRKWRLLKLSETLPLDLN